jgi:hypothetical protein
MFKCTVCKRIKLVPVISFVTGYGIDKEGNKVCYACCAKQELESMLETGKATLYFCKDKVTDWSGELSFKVLEQKTGRHNIANVRYDYWFRTPDAKLWHGYTIGDFSQIAHCKRIKG